MAARFQRNIERGATRGRAGALERDDLRMITAGEWVESGTDDTASAHENRADHRIGASSPRRLSGQAARPPDIFEILRAPA